MKFKQYLELGNPKLFSQNVYLGSEVNNSLLNLTFQFFFFSYHIIYQIWIKQNSNIGEGCQFFTKLGATFQLRNWFFQNTHHWCGKIEFICSKHQTIYKDILVCPSCAENGNFRVFAQQVNLNMPITGKGGGRWEGITSFNFQTSCFHHPRYIFCSSYHS